MTQAPICPQLHRLFAEYARVLISPPFAAEIPGAVPVVTSFVFGLADPTLFPKAELAQARCWQRMGMTP